MRRVRRRLTSCMALCLTFAVLVSQDASAQIIDGACGIAQFNIQCPIPYTEDQLVLSADPSCNTITLIDDLDSRVDIWSCWENTTWEGPADTPVDVFLIG